jgi:hypothetical protein
MFIKLIFIIIVLALNSCKCSLNETHSENLKKLETEKKVAHKSEPFLERDNLIYLSELPLDKLLQVKKSIEEIIKSDSNDIFYDDDYEDFQFANDKNNTDKWKQKNKQNPNRRVSNEHYNNYQPRINNVGNYVAAPTALPLINNYNRHFNRYLLLDRRIFLLYFMAVLGDSILEIFLNNGSILSRVGWIDFWEL